MDFSGIVEDTTIGVYNIINDVLAMNIDPSIKIDQIKDILAQVGDRFGQKMFDDVSLLFDSTAMSATIPYNNNDRLTDLATKIVRDNAFSLNDSPIVKEYYDTLLGIAEHEAFENAKSLEKHPTLTRRIRGETCSWCVARQGTWTDPDGTLFARHDNCDCLIIVSGYNSRNGVLKNYRKK